MDSIRPLKGLGQNFLVCRDIAAKEAKFAIGRNALEMGPGYGTLTDELCKAAKSVVSIEIDKRLYKILDESEQMNQYKNLKIINADFFEVPKKAISACDIMVANIPYNLSSSVLDWLFDRRMEAVLCLQKEFAGHMLAKPSTRRYSKLSVFSSLFFNLDYVLAVPSSCFYPMPEVDSCVVHLLPKRCEANRREMGIIAHLMNHKKKKLRNAIIDSCKQLEVKKESAAELSERIKGKDERVFKLAPGDLLSISREILQNLS